MRETISYCIDFPYATIPPPVSGTLRVAPEDFQVREHLGFVPAGEGEHVFLLIEKCQRNTAEVAQSLARLANQRAVAIGYAGMKDRNAITRQWFSVHVSPQAEPDWSDLNDLGLSVLNVTRHVKKLRRGQHQSNHFAIRLHNLTGDMNGLEERLSKIQQEGVPNYFGPQRFGRMGSNLQAADEFFRHRRSVTGRNRRSFILSAARSYIFNQVLGARINQYGWASSLEGEVLTDGTALATGPLWGRGRLQSSGAVKVLEEEVSGNYPQWRHGLEHAGLQQERRPLCLMPDRMEWALEQEPKGKKSFVLQFTLRPGEFATSVIREAVRYTDNQNRH